MYEIYKNGPCGGYTIEIPEAFYLGLPEELRRESWSLEGEKTFFLFCGEEKKEPGKDCDKCGNPIGTKYDVYDNPVYGDGAETI